MQIWKRYETFLRYAIVGVLGTAVDVLTLYALTEWTKIDPKTSHWFPVFVAIAFLAAVVNNYVLNRVWTFKSQDQNVTAQFVRFLVVSCGGFVLTQGLMWVLVPLLGVWYILAKALTSITVMIWNFGLNKFWTFRHPAVGSTALSS
ncbi:MAG: GtrA family protein [Candidatus Sericytochromatia bacterium]